MNLEKYLQRLNYKGSISPDLKVLTELQRSHLLHIPFENLDIHSNCKIELCLDKLFSKIVYKNRGGFCYELNGLFYWLLISIGFDSKMISARVYNREKGYGQEFDHMAIIVNINTKDYLADVGFGEFSFSPLVLDDEKIQIDERGLFRVVKHDDDYLRVEKKTDSGWMPQYIFTLTARDLTEFEGMCLYHQTSTESSFTQKRLCSLPNESGRITAAGNILKTIFNNETTETIINSEEEYQEILLRYFGIKV